MVEYPSPDGEQVLALRCVLTPQDARGVRRGARRQPALAGGRLAARGRVPVRAPRAALDDQRRGDRGTEGAAAAPARGDAATSGASCATRCARTARSGSPTCRRRDRRRADARARADRPMSPRCPRRRRGGRRVPRPGAATPTCWPATASTCRPGQRVVVRSTTLAAPLLLELQRAILERDAWPTFRVELPGESAGFYAHARDPSSTTSTTSRWRRPRSSTRVLGIQAPYDPRELGRRRPGADRARRPLAATGARGDAEEALVLDAVADGRRRGAGRHVARGVRRRSCARRLFLDQPDPVAAWRGLHAFQAALIERLGARARAAHRGATAPT